MAPPGAPVDIPVPPAPSAVHEAAGPGEASLEAPRPLLPGETALAIDAAVEKAIAEHKVPGCVVVIGRRDAILFERAYGSRALLPSVVAMTTDTVFDLASLTKPVATASSIVWLAQRGKVDLDAPLAKYLPELGDRGRGTLRQALTHTAGFVADTRYADYAPGHEGLVRRLGETPLKYAPGTDARYSDVGFLLLGEVVARVGGMGLDAFARDHVFLPLGMTETGYLPPLPLVARAAPTEFIDGRWLVGEVHDPRARLLGGVAGHAGVFSTPKDMARFAQVMLGATPGFLSPDMLRAFTAPHDVPRGVRALGWDVRSATSSNRGVGLSPRAFGHGGYTGTSLWMDPEKDLFVLVLSNRVHPTGRGEVNPLAGRIADLAARALGPDGPTMPAGCAVNGSDAKDGEVALGLDVLVAERFRPLAGRHVGLVTNAAGVSSSGARDVDLLASDEAKAAGVSLVALFAPEHGLDTDKDAPIGGGHDARTGLPVYSLYGDHFTPTDAELTGIDTLVVNLPDVGTRFFTYASTLHRALTAAAKRGLRVVVLDRPDPIDGVHVEGPVLGRERSFVNHAPLPIRHGLTMGELALFFDAVDHDGVDLEVVPVSHWPAAALWGDLGLAWVPPSPNLHTPLAALLYPGLGLLEGTNVSVGRGTSAPFRVIGAPWMDGKALADALAHAVGPGLAGLTVEATSFVPASSKFTGETCHGVAITVTDPRAVTPVLFGVTLAVTLRRLYPSLWNRRGLAPLLASREAEDAIERGASPLEVAATWEPALAAFVGQREKYLLYPRHACH